MKVYRHIKELVTMKGALTKDGRRLLDEDLSLLKDGAIVFDEQKIHWVGRDKDLPAHYTSFPSVTLKDHVVTPGIIDCHTHSVFAGDRSHEYIQRLSGMDYQQIAKNGGGILFSVEKTLAATDDELFQAAIPRLSRMYYAGVRGVEIKSGYALSIEGELRLLRVIKKLKESFAGKIFISSTFMGAHAVPQGMKSSEHMDKNVLPALYKAHQESLVDAVDIFYEDGFFTKDDVIQLAQFTKELGLPLKAHVDEFNDNDGAFLAVSKGCISAEHLLHSSIKGINALGANPTVAVALPGTAFFLGKPLAPVVRMLNAGAKVAIGSDFNPGSSHLHNVLLLAALSAPTFKMNQAHLWAAITLNAAHAIGWKNAGVLQTGYLPLMSIFKAPSLDWITYDPCTNYAVEE
jgi:imidazolonepropionase